MKKLRIIAINPFGEYILQDKNGKRYSLVLEFYNTDSPKVNDELMLDKQLLDRTSPNFVQPYAFAPFDDEQLPESELLLFSSNEKKLLLKRIYG